MSLHEDMLRELAEKMMACNDPAHMLLLSKKMMTACWMGFEYSTRRTFVSCIDYDGDLAYEKPYRPKPDAILDAGLAGVLKRWPEVLDGLSGAELDFANDIEKRRKWRKWAPSDKQVQWIMRIWSDHIINEPEMDVTE